MSGRTTWWGKDAAWNRRELIVELGEEHGPAGPMVMDVLSCWTQEQRGGGSLRGGFRALAREAFIDAAVARTIVLHAAEIGAIDELQVDEDGRRFTARVSGWEADQSRARAAFRKQGQRAREAEEADVRDPEVTEPDGESRDVTGKPQPDQTRPDQKEKRETRSQPVRFRGEVVPDDVVAGAVRLIEVFNEATGRTLGAWASGGKPSSALKQVIGALLDRPAVELATWEAGVRAVARKPPAWVEGQLQPGHVFGEKGAEWTIGAATAKSNGRAAHSAPCHDCGDYFVQSTQEHRMIGGRCDSCRAVAIARQAEGAPA